MACEIREGALVELRGSKDEWQVVGHKFDGIVWKYVIRSGKTGEVKSAFTFEVFEKYTSTYFEMNQFLFENIFGDDPLFDEITIVPDHVADPDLEKTISNVPKLEPSETLDPSHTLGPAAESISNTIVYMQHYHK